ncbi:MbtH family protein [Micromonospora sp. NPDC047738]|uniref:MbtH family protein n=1 Tax=Micromonospora sp. NPDC047738 TaxID=3155741 RepID=UPI0033F07856
MTTNPFENDDSEYLVLVNDEAQYSLWPAAAEVPAGWRCVHPADSRQDSLDFVERTWTDMRPASLARAMDADRLAEGQPSAGG